MLRNKNETPRFYLHNSRNIGRKSSRNTALIFKPLTNKSNGGVSDSTSPGAESAQAAGRVAAEAAARAAAGVGVFPVVKRRVRWL